MAQWPYNTTQWQRLRRAKLQQQTLCELCLKQHRIVPAVAVDHIVSVKNGGDAFPGLDRLMSLCVACHNRKTWIVENGKARSSRSRDAMRMGCRSTRSILGTGGNSSLAIVVPCGDGAPSFRQGYTPFETASLRPRTGGLLENRV